MKIYQVVTAEPDHEVLATFAVARDLTPDEVLALHKAADEHCDRYVIEERVTEVADASALLAAVRAL